MIDIQDELPEEIDFPSNTSFITKNVVLEKLEEMGYLKPRKDKSKLTKIISSKEAEQEERIKTFHKIDEICETANPEKVDNVVKILSDIA